MDQSRRAVESYWRSRLIDGATSDEDKVTPVYKLEEICELLRSSHVSIVKELSEFILKRLQHKSPVVKQKALRVVKYAVGKSGAEFRREMQRNSAAVRELVHYKGHPDPLKGDSLNKAVRETAQDALSALFANEDSSKSKASTTESLGGRIQGFGNTNFDFIPEDKKASFLSEVVNIGSATIKQGINSLTQSPSLTKNDVGTYKGPNLRSSLNVELDGNGRYEGFSGSSGDTHTTSRFSSTPNSGNWGTSSSEGTDGDSHLGKGVRTREQKLLETIVTSGGVRLQPSRDALHIFVLEASKLDALVLSRAIDSKLKSPHWQVRMKAVCVLEALLRKKDDEHFAIVATYFSENKDLIVNCSESPQGSLREKAIKVLNLIDSEQTVNGVGKQDKKPTIESTDAQIPNLIDTGDLDEHKETNNSQTTEVASTSSSSLIDDLFGGGPSPGSNSHDLANDDPFADVSFHNNKEEEQEADIFSGITVNKLGATEPELFDVFGPSPKLYADQNTSKGDTSDIMAGLSINDNGTSAKQNSTFETAYPGNLYYTPSTNADHQIQSGILNSNLGGGAQTSARSANPAFGNTPYNYQPGFGYNPSLIPQQPINFNSMASILAQQQQYRAMMPGFQHLGNLQSDSSALPDIFNPTLSSQPPTSLMSNSKKEETKAFDFISDHVAAARDPRRVN